MIGAECGDDFSGDSLTVYTNARKCEFIGKVGTPECAYDDMRYFAYSMENDGNIPFVTVAEFSSAGESIRLHWAEIDIK